MTREAFSGEGDALPARVSEDGGREDRFGERMAETDFEKDDPEWDFFHREGKSYQREWSEWSQKREQRYERERRQKAQDAGECRESRPRWWEYKGPQSGEKAGQLLLLIFLFGIPVVKFLIRAGMSVAGGVLGGIAVVFGGILFLCLVLFPAALVLFAQGLHAVFAGIRLPVPLPVGTMMIGAGFLMIAASLLLLLLDFWCCQEALPRFIRFVREGIAGILRWFHPVTGRPAGGSGEWP